MESNKSPMESNKSPMESKKSSMEKNKIPMEKNNSRTKNNQRIRTWLTTVKKQKSPFILSSKRESAQFMQTMHQTTHYLKWRCNAEVAELKVMAVMARGLITKKSQVRKQKIHLKKDRD